MLAPRLAWFILLVLFAAPAAPRAQSPDSSAPLEFRRIATGFSRAVAIAIAPEQERIFVLEAGRHRLLELDPEGLRRDSLGGRGNGAYEFRGPTAANATNGLRIYVADSGNGRIQLFGRRLSHIASIKPEGQDFFTPRYLAVSSFGDVFTYNENRHSLLRFDSGGRLRDELSLSFYEALRRPTRIIGMALQGETLLLLAQNADSQTLIHRLGTGGRYLGFFGQGEAIRHITTGGQQLWAVTQEAVLRYDAAGRLQQRRSYHWPEAMTAEITTRGLAVSRSEVYVLTPAALYRAAL
ncbi:MAG: hypothetical protein ACOC2C_02540 [Cyclonatronaceae bacterium]